MFQGSSYTQSKGECCGKCTPTSCVESKGEMRGDTLVGVKLRQVGGQEITDYLVIHSDTRGEPLWEYSRSPQQAASFRKTFLFLSSVYLLLTSVSSLQVGEVWQSPGDKCVLQQCVKVKDEVFISATNVSCSSVDTPSCPLGTELRCDTQDCCPRCHCGRHTCKQHKHSLFRL